MKSDLILEADTQCDFFGALSEMTRGLVRMADRCDRKLKIQAMLEECLAHGWILRSQFCLSSAGALAYTVAVLSPCGKVVEIINLDAPPSTVPFRLDQAGSAT